MKISTSFDNPPIPTRNCDWSAIDADTYDGTEDDPHRHQIGRGATEDEAVTDLIERLLEDEPAEIVRRVREFDGLVKALRHARKFIKEELDNLIEGCTVGGDLSTMDDLDRDAFNDAFDHIARIDVALAAARAAS